MASRSANTGYECYRRVTAGLALLLLQGGCAIDDRSTQVFESLPDGEPPVESRECTSDEAMCVSSTQLRVCSSDGRWLAVEACPLACVGNACGGVCVPQAQRCASSTEVQRCSDQGEWGAATACPSACSGAGCTGECSPGSRECVSATQQRQCNEQGQWLTPVSCDFTCQGGSCGGECTPDSVRCDAAPAQRCDETGTWRDAPRCEPGGACPAESIERCGEACLSLASDPLNCGACGRDCRGGACSGGRCLPLVLGSGYINPSSLALSETHVYFREGAQGAGRILRIPKGGGAVEVVAQGVSNLVGVALGGEQLYFASGNAATLGQGQVLRANLDGTQVRPFSELRAPGVFSVIVPGLNVYYTERSAMSTVIFRAGLLSVDQAGMGAEVEFETLPGQLLSMTVNSGCMFYVAQGTPQQLRRKCAPAETAAVHYAGPGGEIRFHPTASTDGEYLYFAQGNTLSRIAREPPAAPEVLVSGAVAPPSVDAEALYYAAPTEEAAGAGCSSAYTLYRASKQPGAGAPEVLLPPPLACPTQLALDDAAIYWVSADGSAVLSLAK